MPLILTNNTSLKIFWTEGSPYGAKRRFVLFLQTGSPEGANFITAARFQYLHLQQHLLWVRWGL